MANRFGTRFGATESLDLATRAGMLHLGGAASRAAAITYVRDYTALVTTNPDGSVVSANGVQGRGSFISYSFESKVPAYSRGTYKDAADTARMMDPQEQKVAREALAAWAEVSGITFFEVAKGLGDIKFVLLDVDLIDPAIDGFASPLSDTRDTLPGSGDVYIDDKASTSLYIYLHEIGHALGLKHPHEGDIRLDEAIDDYRATVMSYEPYEGAGQALGTLDDDAIRYLYGDNANDGRQVHSWNWNQATGTLSQYGFDSDDTILGIGGSDVIYGNAGNDMIQGREGSDVLNGGEGNDTLRGGYGAGHDRLNGDNGDDLIEVNHGTGSTLTIDGGNGVDQITFWFSEKANFNYTVWARANPVTAVEKTFLSAAWGNAADRITGGALADRISGRGGNDVLAGGDGDDVVQGDEGNDRLTGGNGDDELGGWTGRDTLDGGAGADRLFGGGDADTLLGGEGADYLGGEDGDDLLLGGEGADTMFGGAGVDTVSYAGEKARVIATINAAREVAPGVLEFMGEIENLIGSDHADTLTGDGNANAISGGAGDDRLLGREGNDRLVGGAGLDRLTGGAGADRFVFDDGDSRATRTTADQILDFSRGERDRIDVSGIDAIAGTARDDRFTAIGRAAFGGHAGELRFVTRSGVTQVEGDMDGDGKADFMLIVTGDALQAGDFIL